MWIIITTTYNGQNEVFGPYTDQYEAMVFMDKMCIQYRRKYDLQYCTPNDNIYICENYVQNMSFEDCSYKDIIIRFEIKELKTFN